MKHKILIIFLILTINIANAGDTIGREYEHYKNSILNILNFEDQKDLLIFGSVALPVAFFIDEAVKDYAQEYGLYSDKISHIGDLYGHRLGYFAVVGGMVVYDVAMRKDLENSLASIRLIAEGVLGGQIVIEQLKLLTGRRRPNGSDTKSFPSGHSGGAFGLATCINAIYGKKVGIPAYTMAVFVATSRIHDNKHYLSDVIAGGMIGTMIARGFAKEYKSHWNIEPEITSKGLGLSLNIRF